MIEKTVTLENISLIDFLGIENKTIDTLSAAFPKSKIVSRGNEILIKVFDPQMPPPLAVQMPSNSAPKEVLKPPAAKNSAEPPLEKRFDYNEIPHGKQNWYVQTSGLWQAVTLETVPVRYVEWVHVTPHNSGDGK